MSVRTLVMDIIVGVSVLAIGALGAMVVSHNTSLQNKVDQDKYELEKVEQWKKIAEINTRGEVSAAILQSMKDEMSRRFDKVEFKLDRLTVVEERQAMEDKRVSYESYP